MKKFYRILSLVLVVCMVFTMAPATALAADDVWTGIGTEKPDGTIHTKDEMQALKDNYPQKDTFSDNNITVEGVEISVNAEKVDAPDVDLKANKAEAEAQAEKLDDELYADGDIVDVIVVMEGESLLDAGFTTLQISRNTAVVAGRVQTMRQQQEALLKKIRGVVEEGASSYNLDNASVTLRYYYNVAISGLGIEVPYGALAEIKNLPGVANAFVAPCFDVPEDMSDVSTSPYMYATQEAFGSAETWASLGYTGAGMRIAVLDTGIDTDHPSFAASPVLTEDSLTVEEIASVLTELNAYAWYGETLTAEDLYISEKIPFGFNYGFNSLDVTHDNDYVGDHGTHVSGIAAANKCEGTDVVGVAPDAQIIAMKVFNASGSASGIDILAAMEDAFRLNVDVMNLSLGSDAGFSDMDELFNKIYESDMIVSISAGNSYSSAYGNAWGTDTNMTSDPDNGIVGWPATMYGATVVASLENSHYMANYITVGDNEIVYYDYGRLNDAGNAVLYFPDFLAPDGETAYEYVMIPGFGAVEDYEGIDVAGKIAVVMRGELAFTDKQLNAAAADAIACIVYDNVPNGGVIYMQDAGSIPNVFISYESGMIMAEAAVDGVGTLVVKALSDVIPAENPSAGQMSVFSSWGVTPDLRLLPNVTAPGGNIYSCYTDGQYGMMSGTSMSAPHIAGMSALVLQYLRDKYDLSDSQAHTIAEALIMSTATPVVEWATTNDDGSDLTVEYSPRLQGSGSANVYDAISSPAYLTVSQNYGGQPSVSLGDDDAKTGVYRFSFEINNLSGEELSYGMDASVLTDFVDTTYLAYGLAFMGESAYPLGADVSFSVAGGSTIELDANKDGYFNRNDIQYVLDVVSGAVDGSTVDYNSDGKIDTADAQWLYEYVGVVETVDMVTVPANGSVTVNVTIKLDANAKAYMDAYYPNGIYVEGFVRCYAANEGAVDLSLPYMGFYGDWSAASAFDTGWWYEAYAGDYYTEYNHYLNMLWTNFGSSDYLLGINPYINEYYDPAHNVLSPNGDGYNDYINEIYLSLMRSLMGLEFNWADSEGNELFNRMDTWFRKTFYVPSYGLSYPFIYSEYFYQADEEGNVILDENGWPIADIYDYSDLENGDTLSLTVNAWLDDGDENVDDSLSFPIVIDTEAPVITGIMLGYDEETDTRTLYLGVSDNYDIAAVIPLTMAGAPYEYIAVNEKTGSEGGEEAILEIDVTGYDSTFMIALGDYGANEAYYQITFEGEANIDYDKFYAYMQAAAVDYYGNGSYYIVTDYYNGWYSFEDPSDMLMHTSMYGGETIVTAAEYVDGYIFGVDINGQIFAMKSGDWKRIPIGTMPTGYNDNYEEITYPALDMAYDYANGVMYILGDSLTYGGDQYLYSLDIFTGYVEEVGAVSGMSDGSQALTLACDNDGVLYTIDYATGALYTLDAINLEIIEAAYWWQDDEVYVPATYVGETGYVPQYQQSMTVDHETNTLYWAAFQSVRSLGTSVLCEVDKASGALTPVSQFMHNAEMTGLFKPWDCGEDIIPDAELEAMALSAESLVLNANSYAELEAYPVPFNAELDNLTWTSSDESVALVYDGVVYTLGEGRAVITASCGDISAECVVDVLVLTEDLTFYDNYNYFWRNVNAGNTADAEYIWDAINPYSGILAAAYFDGWVYASEYGGNFYRVDPATMQGNQIGSSQTTIYAMAFNYADGYMYGLEQYSAGMWDQYNYLVRINLNSGEIERVGMIDSTYTPFAMAIDYEGNIYAFAGNNWYGNYELIKISAAGEYVNIDWSWDLGYDLGIYYYTSMVYSAKDNGIYLADSDEGLIWIDMESLTEDNWSPRMVYVGAIGEYTGYGSMNMAMFAVPEAEPELPETPVTAVNVPASYLMLVGGSVSAGVTAEPWNAYPTVSYATADESVAVVDENGNIFGVSAGSTTLTVSVEGWPTVYEIPVTVVESTGELHGFLISDFMYGGNSWVSISDTDPVYGSYWLADQYDVTVFSGAYYNGTIYGYGQDQGWIDYKNYFVTFDADTFEMTMGAKINYTLRDMAMDYTTGNLYAIAEGGTLTGAVAQLDMATGEVTIIAETGKTFAAMTIDAEGNMYGICEDGNLYLIDKESGETTLIGSTGVKVASIFQSMHYDLDTGNTYWAHVAPDQSSSLRLVDLESGASTSLGTITPAGSEIGALYTIPGEEPTEPDMDTLKVTGIKLPEKATVAAGSTVQLDATVLTAVELKPSEVGTMSVVDAAAAGITLNWTSSDNSVATVDENGLVTGLAAGTAVITASAQGKTASCTVVVTEGERLFYAYDRTNCSWISFSGSDPSAVATVRADAEGETPILAAAYTGKVVYAYDENGEFWLIDAESFERSYIGSGIAGLYYTATVSGTDWWTGESYSYDVDCELGIIDLSYDTATGKLYAAVSAVNEDEWIEMYGVAEVDTESGALSMVVIGDSFRPGNLLVDNGKAFFVDTYMSGILNVIDLNSDEPAASELALVQGYWGDTGTSTALVKDELTGTVYAFRDFTDIYGSYDADWNYIPWDGVTGEAWLVTLNLGDADISEIGMIGEGLLLKSLFIK